MAMRGRSSTAAGLGLFWMLLGGLACAEPEAGGDGTSATIAPAAQERPAAQAAPRPASRLPLDRITLPPGFAIEAYSEEVPGARSLALSPGGVLYVGTRQEGKVYAVLDRDRDGRAERVVTVASGLATPNGVAWRDGALYVAEVSRILRYPGIDGRLDDPPQPEVVSDAFPGDRHHGWKFIAFGPDGRLYVPVGAPCNVCDSESPIYATITRLPVSGGGRPEIFASGVRNTVGFDWQPGTGVLWFTDNGADMMGDDVPPDELNRAPRPGLNFGYPHCHGKDIRDPRFGRGDCGRFAAPAIALGPHVAALGMRFYTGRQFPAEYRGQVFIAEHGSWNRSEPIGYRVTLVEVQGDRALSYEPFAHGWLGSNGEAWGRPVDLLVAPDGALLVSDDEAGAIYRISYRGG